MEEGLSELDLMSKKNRRPFYLKSNGEEVLYVFLSKHRRQNANRSLRPKCSLNK